MIGHVIGARNFEHVRRRVAEILDEELENQSIIGYDEDLEVAVYEERITPINYEEKRVVNVRLNSNEFDNFFQLNKDGTISIAIDVYCTYAGDGSLSMKKLQKIIGVIDAILSDSRYKTLGFAKPSISRVQITGFQISDERVQHDSTNTCLGRVNLEVRTQETVDAIQPILLDGYFTRVLISDSNEGFVYENPPCAPGTLRIINSENVIISVEIIDSGASETYELPDTPVLVVDQDDNELGNGSVASVTGGTIQVQIDPTPCAPVTYNVEYANGDPIESGSEPSGGHIEVIVPNPVCAPATFELNGIEVGTAASGGSLDFPVKNTANTQVGSLVSGEFIVPNATIQLTTPSGVLQTVSGASGTTTSQTLRTIGRMPYKTGSSGASTPPVSGVDGLTQRGRNFLTLDYNNAWGNPNRFTWNNGTQTYPNGVTAEGNGYAVDNSTWDKDGKILLIAYVTTTRSYANQATTALGVTIDGLSGWQMINAEELSEITTGNAIANKQINIPPFNIPEGTVIISSTEYVANNVQCLALLSGGVEGAVSKAGLRNTFFVRVATLTIDEFGNVTIS